MPAKSRQQYKFMKGIESGSIKRPGFTPEQAKEYTAENVDKLSYKNLPKLKKMMKPRG